MTELKLDTSQTQEFCRLAGEITRENMRQTRALQETGPGIAERAAWFALGALCVLGLQWAL